MSAQDRHDAQDRPSEPVQREPPPAEPAGETHQRPQQTPFLIPGYSEGRDHQPMLKNRYGFAQEWVWTYRHSAA